MTLKKIKLNNVWLIGLLNVFIVTFWLLNSSYFPVHDFTAGARVYELHQTLLSGQFPPRWSQNFGFGLGMPLFEFYAPLAFLVAEGFHLLGISILTSIKLSYLASTIIGFIGAYLFGKKLTTIKGGLIAATAFTLAPYHAVNLYVRGAMAEYWAISFIPLAIYSVINLYQKFDKKSYFIFTLSLAGLFLSHNITTLIFAPFLIAIIIGLFLFKPNLRNTLRVFVAGLHSIALAAFFLIPAFVQKSFTRVDSITEGYSQFQFHFIYFRQLFYPNWGYGGSILGIDDKISFYLGATMLILSVIGFFTISLSWLKNRTDKKSQGNLINFYYFSFLTLIALILTNFKSSFIWLNLPLIKFVQFPWRFLGVVSFLLSLLSAFSINNSYIKRYWAVVLSAIFILNGFFFRPERLINYEAMYDPNPGYIQDYMSSIMPDYLPPGADWESLDLSQDTLVASSSTVITVDNDNANQISATLLADQPDTITINRFIFPNWQVSINQDESLCHQTNLLVYQCPVPAGESSFNMIWKEKGINQTSDFISLFGLISLGFIYLVF